ncbi:MAG: YegS/Rv2252/BmrU family lipid kinase [Oscillospiraceae bacterium]|nr:YegS/Rv2252/BmrU family lipid kinase [Oscillospiraceae bacterium]
MKHLFIVNPTAGGKDKTEEVRAKVGAAFRGRAEPYEIYVTKAPMDAAEKIRAEAASGEHVRVYACGGDGTFNECVCGAALREHVAVCPFPTGTGTDFCRMFGDECECFRDLDAVLDGWETPIDLIRVNGRYSANICSVGIDARIGTDVHKYSGLPLIGGATGYVVSAVVNVFKGITRNMRVRCGDYAGSGKHTIACVCNGRYYGGGFNPAPGARPDDGDLDIFIVRDLNLFGLARMIGKYAAGRADEFPDHILHLHGTEVEVEFDEENVVNVDGEALYADKVHMQLLPAAMRLVVPRGMRFFGDAPAQPSARAAAGDPAGCCTP